MSAEQETAEDVAWLRQQMQLAYTMAGRYKSALDLILAYASPALDGAGPDAQRAALAAVCKEADRALDETWGMAARPTPAPPAEGQP